MKPLFVLGLVAALSTAVAVAQTTTAATAAAAPPAPSSAGLANDWLRQQSGTFSSWDIGGQFRARFEHREHSAIPGSPGAIDFRDHGADTDNTYELFRTTLRLGHTPTAWAGVLVEGRDSVSLHDDRVPDPESDRTELHQTYLRLGDPAGFPLSAKIGRQELSYGDERLVGAFDWNNVGRVFDTAKLRYEDRDVWVDVFAGRVVILDDHNLDLANDYDWFSGIYASSKTLVPFQETQAYVLARNTGTGSPTTLGAGLPAVLTGAGPRDIYTIGVRMRSLPGKLHGWDHSIEAAGQSGRFKDTVTGPSLSQLAFATHIAGGYTFADLPMSPRLGLEHDHSSGDSDPTDGRHGTFDNLFPANHRFYGHMDFASWQNLHDLRASASLKPVKPLLIALDWHAFWLADTHDSFYQVNGARRTGQVAGPGTGYGTDPAFESFIGQEADLTATWTLRPWATLQAGYGHFFVGGYIERSLASPGFGATDADFFFTQASISF